MAVYKNKQTKSEKKLTKLQKESVETLEDKNTSMTENEDGTITVDFLDEDELQEAEGLGSYSLDQGHYTNLVSTLTLVQRLDIAEVVVGNVQDDDNSRRDWLETIKFGFDLLGVKVEEKNTPFEGACSAQHPLLMESAVKFQSKASNELLPCNGPVKTKVLGDVTVEKEDQAHRVKEHMNYQILEQMTEFYPDSERMLLYVPLVGSGFKKTYYSSYLERPCSEFVPADQFIVPNSAPDLFRADRYTHLLYKTSNEMEADYASGLYQRPEEGLGEPSDPKLSDVQKKTHQLMGIEVGLGERDKVYTLYEQHILLHIEGLDEDDELTKGYNVASPYVITVDSASHEILSVRRNWAEDDKKRKKKVIFTHYNFVPSFNFYGFGFLHLLGNLQLSLTAALRSLVDAGQFANLQGGFKLKGVRITGDNSPVHPGQFKEVESHIMDINKSIMSLPFKEPSSVLYQMLQFLDTKGQKFADSTEQVIQDSANYGPVGTTMALLEASTKFFSAIHKRLHASLKHELKIIADINSETLADNTEYNIENQTMQISRDDYDTIVDVVPVSDPNMSSSAHRMAKAQTLFELAQRAPELHDMREVLKHVYVNMDYANIDRIMPKPEEAQQNDPMTDIQISVEGKPIKAFEGQDHKSHIALKQAFLQDPQSGQNPMMQKAAIQIQANIQEHMLLDFTEQVQAMAQQQQGQDQSPEQGMAQAAQQVAQMNLQQMQQQQAAQQNDVQDKATMLLAQAELMDTETQARKQNWTEKKDTADLELKKEQLDLAKMKLINEINALDKKIAAETDKLVTTKGLDAMIQGMSQTNKENPTKEEKGQENDR